MIAYGSVALFIVFLFLVCVSTTAETVESPPLTTEKLDQLTLTVVFDNTACNDACEASWGFACVVEVPGSTILFDTGADGDMLLSNMRVLGIDPESIDMVVLSHDHWDHVDGLGPFLAVNSDVTVVVPQTFPPEIRDTVIDAGAQPITATESTELHRHILTTGEMGDRIIEQALLIETVRGLVVITGCAHPGIADILRSVADRHPLPIQFVLGGFHLKDTPEADIREIIGEFERLGVRYAGATHCTGDEAIRLFAETYGDRFMTAGAGRIISLDDIP